MRLQPDTCPKCGLDILPTDPLCALHRRHNFIIGGLSTCVVAVAGLFAFQVFNAPPAPRPVAPVQVVAATPAPTRTPIVIQDAPFVYNTDAPQFAAPSQTRFVAPLPSAAVRAPRRRFVVYPPVPMTQMAPREYLQPMTQNRAMLTQSGIEEMAQSIRNANDIGQLPTPTRGRACTSKSRDALRLERNRRIDKRP